MMIYSINNRLRSLAEKRYYIPHQSVENLRIKNSITHVRKRLNHYFKDAINSVEPFGSYERDTILPRRVDGRSDIDIMIVFNYDQYERTSETYRKQLINFANAYYSRSSVLKSFPTVVVELNHIKLDLIPTVVVSDGYVSQFYIPDRDNSWQETDPYGFNQSLVAANTKFNSLVKPIIRLMKAWNCTHGYPYESFRLEQEIAAMDFTGDDYERAFFWAADHLPIDYLTLVARQKVEALRNNCEWLVEYDNRGKYTKAHERLLGIFP